MISPITEPKSLRKGLFFSLLLVCISLNCLAQPAINAFSPASGAVGTAVTITGANFSATPSNNIVFVGGVKANVTAATTSSLTVTVPAGAIFQPITVTTNGLTASSKNPFIVTFSGAATQFTARSFDYAGRVDSVESGIETTKHAVGDLDGDNKIDEVTIDRLHNTMSVYPNTSTGGKISFAAKTDYATGNYPRGVTIGDIDGDGKPDVIVTNYSDQTVSIFKNTTVGGMISFASGVVFSTDQYPAGVSVADIDNDGRLDLVVRTINLETWVSVLRNTSSGGVISFANKESLMTLAGVGENVRTVDVDGDGKTDILLSDYNNSRVLIYRNTSAVGALSFAAKQGIWTGFYPYHLETGDLNSDGKPDLVVSYFSESTFMVITNTSSPGAIAFSDRNNYSASSFLANSIAINDLDGDGKPDLAVAAGSDGIALYKNSSATGGAITFYNKAKLATPFNDYFSIADFDNDGKPDIAPESGIFRVTVWKNNTTSPQVLSFSPNTVSAGATVTITGINFAAATAVSFGDVPAASFSVVNDNTITAVVGAGASGLVTVKNAQDSGSAGGFVFTAPPVITGFTPTSGPEGAKITITGNYFMNVTAVKFGDWNAAYFSVIDEHTIIATINNNASSGDITVKTNYGTASAPGFTFTPRPQINYFNSSWAGPGNTVEIGGTGFSGATAVSFGGVPARVFTIVSSNLIKAVVDTGASGAIVVTTPLGVATKDGFVFVPGPVITSYSPASATVGELVTITGKNLGWVNGVQFGGVPAKSYSIQNVNTILAYVGNGATGDVTVSARYGSDVTLPGFTFKPLPIITSFSPAGGPVNTTVTITGEHFTDAQKVYFGGKEAASFTIVSDNIITAVTGVGDYGDIVITNAAGFGRSAVSFNYQYPKPEITSFSPASGATGTQVTIKGKNFLPGRTLAGFGNTSAANVVANSDTSLIATVGEGSSGDVYVWTMGGSANIPGFTYIPPPPAVTGISPANAGEGMAVVISGKRFTGATAVTFGGVPATSFTVDTDSYITAIVGKGASGEVEVTTPDGTGKKDGFIFGGVVINSFSPAVGGPGTVVTITGSGFVNVSYVYFGRVSASSVTVNSPTSMTVTVPANGTGLVTVNTYNGLSGVSDAFAYLSPVTTITSVAPNVGGPGTIVSIKGGGFSNTTAVSFGGVPAASYTVNSSNSITATVAGGATGNVSVTSPLGNAVYSGFSYTGAPVITRFLPEAALSGSTITITGSNFNPNSTANIVYFGGLKAEVLTASEKSLTVKVPAGAPYSYISVINNNLTGYSQKKFNTLINATASLSAGSFEAKIDSAWGTRHWHVNAADFDLDGKPDVAVCHSGQINTSHIAIFKNHSSTGKLSFLPKEFLSSNSGPFNSVTGDLDGDGKLDLMVANAYDGQNLSVYRNASTSNSLAFDKEILLSLTGVDRNFVACTDVDADGKPDIIIAATYTGGKTTVYRNTSTPGNLSFVKVTLTAPDYVFDAKVADMDLDGKPDLVLFARGNYASSQVFVMRNVSNPGSVAFETALAFQPGIYPISIALGDIDGDGKMDIINTGSSSYGLSIVRNLSIPGKIVMDYRKDFMTTTGTKSVAIADMNGDGKADILTSFEGVSKIVIYPNTSTPGNFTFGNEIELSTTAPVNSICVSDLDSDQRPDIIVSNQDAGSISFFRNKLSAFVLNSFSPAIGSTGTVVTIKGENLTNATTVTIGGVPVSSFTVIDATTITAVVGAGNSGDVSVTTPLGTIKQSGFVYIGPPAITSFTPTTAGTGSTVIIKGTYFTGATAVSFGGVEARSFIVTSDSTISAVVALGASGTVAVTTPLGKGTRDGFIYDPLTAIVEPGNANSKELTVKPNPANDVLIIKHPGSAKAATLRFVDITGRTVKVIVPAQGATETITSVNGLQAGIYTLIWSDGSRSLSRLVAVQ